MINIGTNKFNNQEILDETLFYAVIDNDIPIVKRCISEGANVNFKRNGYSVLFRAMHQSKFKLIIILLLNGADPTFKVGPKSSDIIYRLATFFNDPNTHEKPIEVAKFKCWLLSYKIQKLLISKNENVLFSLYKNNILHDKLKLEHAAVLSALELNLI